MKLRKIKDLRKRNKGNKTARTEKQILSAIERMLLNNPMKKPVNRINQSERMRGNKLWELRKME